MPESLLVLPLVEGELLDPESELVPVDPEELPDPPSDFAEELPDPPSDFAGGLFELEA
ncbi:hypothetical protein WMF37_10830 [Sorangium sp. So ce291]|uniref:hypothetical protein n=1 Tax=Sorangium sp. So ce291 TaxID=3133294 RepID=UPI003F5E65DB